MSEARDISTDLSVIFSEFLAQRRQGKSATLDEFCQRYPDVAEQLRQHVCLYDAFEDTAPATDSRGDRPEMDPSLAPGTTKITAIPGDIERLFGSLEDDDQRTLPAQAFQGESQSAFNGRCPKPSERYHRLRLHATGGIGRVWLARDSDLGRDIALKELRPEHAEDATFEARFLQEAWITGQLEHPAIMPVYSLVRARDGQQPFYTMRFVKGRTLSAAARAYHDMRSAGRADALELSTLLNAFVTVCNAVAYAHSRGVIHRDLKGQNVILGDFGEVVLLDWGLAKLAGPVDSAADSPAVVLDHAINDNAYTMQGEMLGTPAYMAPEQAAGRLDLVGFHTDVYGLGAILYEILTAGPPFAGHSVGEVLRKVRDETPGLPRVIWPDVPPELEALCLQALAKQPKDRLVSANEMGQQVQRWLAEMAERKQADLQRGRFFALSLDLMTIVGSDGYYKELNPAWEKTFGWTNDELRAKPWVDFLHPDDVAPTISAAQRLFAGTSLAFLENRFRCKDGSYRWMHWTGQVIAGQQLIYCVGRDITDRKQVEEALRESQHALQQSNAELASLRRQLECDSSGQQKRYQS